MVTIRRIDKRPLFLLVAVMALLVATTGCAVNPVTGRNELSFIGEQTELTIGQQQYAPAQQSQGGRYLADLSLTEYVNQVGARIAGVSDRALPYEFVVLNESAPNAWALPGGKIAVNRGLLLALRNEAELAAVLGHEVVHSAARHGAKAMQRGTLLKGAVLATSIAVEQSEYANYVVGGAQLSSQLLQRKYGRGAELEADHYGIEYMVRAGYDPVPLLPCRRRSWSWRTPDKKVGSRGCLPPTHHRSSASMPTEKGSDNWILGPTLRSESSGTVRTLHI